MNFNTFEIAQNIRSKKFSEAEAAINFFITDIAENSTSLDIPISSDPLANKGINREELNYNFVNQFSSLISELFSSPNYKPSKATVNVFFKYKFVVEWIFSASIWNNTDALIEHLGLINLDATGKIKLNKRNSLPLMMLITLSSKYKLPWVELFKREQFSAYIAYTSLLTQPIPALTKENSAGFNYLLESAKDLSMFDLPSIEDLGKLNYPFFSCSYATSPDKYELKKWLTKLIRHNLSQWLSPAVKQHTSEIRPLHVNKKMKVGVMLELFSTDHAMYRCYNSALKGLSEQYELIAFIDEQEANNSDLSAFNKVITFKNILDINANAELICQENLDIIFYPSIGMSFWGICLSQLRLAPMQMMSVGHPSSSFSPAIDYVLVPFEQHQLTGCQSYFTEKLISSKRSWQESNTQIIHSDLTTAFIEKHNHYIEDNDNIKIAINGVITKVTYDIIDVCKKLQSQSTKKITFIFFTTYASDHLAYISTKKQLSKMLKNVELSAYSNYLSYMKDISQCQLLLPTLPFGGTNSNIDAMVLNKPKFFIKGDAQSYTRTDHVEWERVGLVEELGCNNVNELVKKSIALIEDNVSRKSLYDIMKIKCTLSNIFSDESETNKSYIHLFSSALAEEELPK